tara:strand:+ start:136 stop:612 length:477 start_codon:yes stop_codon:yes gene_type:complete
MKKHEVRVRIDGVEKWVDANVWFDWMSKNIKDDMEKRKLKFISNAIAIGNDKNIDTDIITRFCDYWTESNPNGRKMRFEMEKIFDAKKRISTFVRNQRSWTGGANTKDHLAARAADAKVEEQIAKRRQEFFNATKEKPASPEEIKNILGNAIKGMEKK